MIRAASKSLLLLTFILSMLVFAPTLAAKKKKVEEPAPQPKKTDEIDRYVWLGDRVGPRKVLIAHLPSGDDHTLKNIVVGRHHHLAGHHRLGRQNDLRPCGIGRPDRP